MNKRLYLVAIGIASVSIGCASVDQATSRLLAASSPQAKVLSPRQLSQVTLVNFLGNRLGVNAQQAMGGVGSIFALAQQRMSPEDFMLINRSVPDMDSYLAAIPESRFRVQWGGVADTMSGLGSLGSSFDALGMNPEMAYQFVPLILQYMQQQNELAAMSLLRDALYY